MSVCLPLHALSLSPLAPFLSLSFSFGGRALAAGLCWHAADASPGILHEGPAIVRPRVGPGEVGRKGEGRGLESDQIRHGEARVYGRGSAAKSLDALSDPTRCRQTLLMESRASTSVGPVESRLRQWEAMSVKANLEPFRLTPEGMYTIMRGLKIGGYRSAMQYLDLAKQEHIRLGHCWTEQHAQAYKVCARSCKRGLGSAKQAAALPLGRLHEIDEGKVSVPSGPTKPVTSTIVASWWLLRELEASRARVRHITLQADTRTVSWLLPSSKTDVAALGATRRHSCSCSVLQAGLCPYHLVVELIRDKGPADPVFSDARGLPPAKAGWADTFQQLASMLNLPICWPNGARAYTGHSARATGAQFMASRGIELWRVQIFGRWGSDAILRYVREAPLEQLAELAIESGHREALSRIRLELETLLSQAKPLLAIPDQSWLPEMSAHGVIRRTPTRHKTVHGQPERFIMNTSRGGKVHRCLSDLNDPAVALNPSSWRTCCLWPFASGEAGFSWVKQTHKGAKCKHCFPESREAPSSASSSSDSSSAASSSSDSGSSS